MGRSESEPRHNQVELIAQAMPNAALRKATTNAAVVVMAPPRKRQRRIQQRRKLRRRSWSVERTFSDGTGSRFFTGLN